MYCTDYTLMPMLCALKADMKVAVAAGNVLDAYRVLVEQALTPVGTPELHLYAAGCVSCFFLR